VQLTRDDYCFKPHKKSRGFGWSWWQEEVEDITEASYFDTLTSLVKDDSGNYLEGEALAQERQRRLSQAGKKEWVS